MRTWLLSPARVAAIRSLLAGVNEPDAQGYLIRVTETAAALEELQRVATDLEYFLDEYWGRRFEQFSGHVTFFLAMEAAAARVNPSRGVWNTRPREMRRVLDWLSEPGRMDEMRRIADARGWHLEDVPMLQKVLDGELPPQKVW